MSTLARALEANGIATVALVSNLAQAETVGPPRALYCEFPLGRPLGRPLDSAFQRRVLDAAFALLPHQGGSRIETFDAVIEDEADQPLSCPIPPRQDAGEPTAVSEARGLRPAYDRALERIGATQVGRVVDAEGIADAIRPFAQVVEGTPWNAVDYPGGDPTTLLMDIRAYYEEAAIGLSDHVPAARASETWYYQQTAMGALVREYLEAVTDADPPFAGMFYVIPMSQTQAALF